MSERKTKKLAVEKGKTLNPFPCCHLSTEPLHQFYVLADSTFNPAAVDELACVRGGGDAVVHYGRAEAPLLSDDDDVDAGHENADDADDDEGAALSSPPAVVSSSSCSLPTLFVFGRQDLDVPAVSRAVVERARALRDSPEAAAIAAVVVLPDQPLCHAAAALRAEVAALVAAEDASSSDGKKLPAVVVAAPAFRAVEPRGEKEEEELQERTEGGSQTSSRQGRPPSRRSFNVREPSRSSTLGGLTWTLPFPAAAPASCAFVWVGPGDDDCGGGGGSGEGRDGAGANDEACASARQLLRLSLAAASVAGWAEVCPRSGALRVLSPLDGTRRLLGRRYFAVQKAANASLVGVVTATSAGGEQKREEEGGKGPSGASPAAPAEAKEEGPARPPSLPAHVAASDALLRLARARGKGAYALAMGRPTAAKLSNFPELGAFVLVAPPGGQLPPPGTLEALAPVLTPAEAVIAWGCGRGGGRGGAGGAGEGERGSGEGEEGEGSEDDDPASRWDPSSYSLDSLPAVARAANAAAEALERRSRRRAEEGGGGGVARLSLVDGASHGSRPPPSLAPASSPPSPPSSSQLSHRRGGSLLADASNGADGELACAADFLAHRRSWRGLETPATGGVPAAEAAHAVEGLRGRAAGYEGEGDK